VGVPVTLLLGEVLGVAPKDELGVGVAKTDGSAMAYTHPSGRVVTA